MRDKADELRQMILDRLFYTEPRDVFSLSSEGYYPQGSGQLGGTPDPSDRPVMQVSSPRTVYLRGVILNDYDGHAWRNTMGGRRNLWLSPRTQGLRDQVFDQSLPAVAQTGSMAAPASFPIVIDGILYHSSGGLGSPRRIISPAHFPSCPFGTHPL